MFGLMLKDGKVLFVLFRQTNEKYKTSCHA